MLNLLYLIPAFPLAGFVVLALLGKRMPKNLVALIGAGSVGLSALLALLIAISFVSAPPKDHVFIQTLGTWFDVGDLNIAFSLSLDSLSLLMTLVITFVGFLIHLYSTEFMEEDEGYSRFFAYLNLFVASMLILVLADSLPFLYLGWEGVGLCSYLLIGFWYKDPANGKAARKAFVVTRIGDTAFAIGLFLLFTQLGTLNIRELMQAAEQQWPVGSTMAVLAAALLLGGALGKSAQLPLQVWLPDAMAGPTPVSALIHAATMVTAGVYLIARTHVLYSLAPVVQSAIALIGATTLLIAGTSALAQKDIKRILAYSTISQIGYMFLALGVGAWTAAMFHFLTHAFFKALLFLGAGAVILAQREEHDITRMGGLRKPLPIVFWTFLIGAASLSSLPLVTAGFFSKDLILWQVVSSPSGGAGLWAAGLLGAFVTSLYTFRMVFLTFFGEQKIPVTRTFGKRMTVPLAVLAAFSVFAGYIELPHTLGDVRIFSGFVSTVLPGPAGEGSVPAGEIFSQAIAAAVSLAGIWLAYLLFLRHNLATQWLFMHRPLDSIRKFWLAGWDYDALYDTVIVRPFLRIVRACKRDFIDRIYDGMSDLAALLNASLVKTQNGNIRWYAAGIAAGAAILLGFVLFLQ